MVSGSKYDPDTSITIFLVSPFRNADSVSVFWRKWNIPVHLWCVRHVYKPLRHKGYSALFASNFVFAISGVFHEYAVCVPLKMVNVHFFIAMASQALSEVVLDMLHVPKHARNHFMWLSVLFGQSLLVITYVNDFTRKYQG